MNSFVRCVVGGLISIAAVTVPTSAAWWTAGELWTYPSTVMPCSPWYPYSIGEYCIPASSMPTQNAVITQIGWYIWSDLTISTLNSVRVYLREFTTMQYPCTTPYEPSAMTLVYTGNLNGSGPNVWITRTLQTSFTYHAGYHLLVMVCDDSGPDLVHDGQVYWAANASSTNNGYWRRTDYASQFNGCTWQTAYNNCQNTWATTGFTYQPIYTATRTPTKSPTKTVTRTPTRTPSRTPTRTATLTPSLTPSESPTPSQTDTPTETPSATPTQTSTLSPSLTPSETPTETPTVTLSPTSTVSSTPTASPVPTPVPPIPSVDNFFLVLLVGLLTAALIKPR